MDKDGVWHPAQEVMPARRARLLFRSRDRHGFEMAEEQRTDAAVSDHRDRAATGRAARDALDSRNDARLRVDRPLPAADALVRTGEEGVDGRLEFRSAQISRRRAIVLAERGELMKRKTRRLADDLRTIDRFLLRAAIDGLQVRDPRLAHETPHSLNAALGERPPWNRNRGIDDDVGMGDEVDESRHTGGEVAILYHCARYPWRALRCRIAVWRVAVLRHGPRALVVGRVACAHPLAARRLPRVEARSVGARHPRGPDRQRKHRRLLRAGHRADRLGRW